MARFGEQFRTIFNWYIKGHIYEYQLKMMVPKVITQEEADMIVALSGSNYYSYIAQRFKDGHIEAVEIWRLHEMGLISFDDTDLKLLKTI